MKTTDFDPADRSMRSALYGLIAALLTIFFLLFIFGGIPDTLWRFLASVGTKIRETLVAAFAVLFIAFVKRMPGLLETSFLRLHFSTTYRSLIMTVVTFIAVSIAGIDTWNTKEPIEQRSHQATVASTSEFQQYQSVPPTTVASQPEPNFSSAHIGPPKLYPDADMTPGAYATLNDDELRADWTEGCPGKKPKCTYSQAHRKVSKSERGKVYKSYHVPKAQQNKHYGEVDHFIPLCAGGSNAFANLWYQPKKNEWAHEGNFGYKEKDKLETYVCRQIKAKHMNARDAYMRMTSDWVRFYIDEFGDDNDLEDQVDDDEEPNS